MLASYNTIVNPNCLSLSINFVIKIAVLLVFDYLPFSAQHINPVLLRQSHFPLERSLMWSSSFRKATAWFSVVSRVEQSYQKVMALWHQLHVNTKSLISWNYLRKDLDLVKTWNLEKVIVKSFPQAYILLASFFQKELFFITVRLLPIQRENSGVRDSVS